MNGHDDSEIIKYSAFISYSHRDARFAGRLHRRLENFQLPRHLGREESFEGNRIVKLLPIFRDQTELRAAPDLTEAIKAAISESKFLIVICSEASAESEWVRRGIE